jgi:DNA-binding HxlR family transcriptional regulator
MKWDALEEEPCSLARTVAVIGDRWSLLILRECFLRIRRFDEFQASLGVTRHLLADRLKKLVRFGVLRRIPYQEAPKRYEYILTQKGPRPLSDHHVDRALGQHPHGRLARTAAAARTQELQEDVRSRNGLLGMR